MLSRFFLDFSVGVGAFVIGLRSISSFSLFGTFFRTIFRLLHRVWTS